MIAIAAACALLTAAGCNNNAGTTAATTEAAATTTTAAAAAEPAAEGKITGDPISHEDYIAADVETEVIVETYVQGKQSWWEDNGVGKASFYAQNNPEGGYFFYEMPCTKEEYDQIVPGTKLKVHGYKAEWSGEIEIIDTEFDIISGDTFIASAEDVTGLLGKDELVDHQNELVSFKGMTVEAANDEGAAFMYKYDNSGSDGDDLYFNVSKDGTTYTFTVESYLCDKDSQVYSDVKALNVGDVIDLEGFLYWYNGANPHITSVSKA
ncbi:MAG: hypothetical protein IK990_14735 [Ruminiclostridium sp.]|nr:hypothetical protein [Ruminiclostridium sp.]